MTTAEAVPQQAPPPSDLLADPEARLAAFERQFGEYGGVNASVEVSTTFTGAGKCFCAGLEPWLLRGWWRCSSLRTPAAWPWHVVPGTTHGPPCCLPPCPALAVLEADTLPQIFTGQKGPDAAHGGCYL